MGLRAVAGAGDRSDDGAVRLLAVLALLLLAAQAATAKPGPGRLAPFEGRGSWVSIYDRGAWADPERVVARLAANRVGTLFLETGNDRRRRDVFRPAATARFIVAAHRAGIRVVGWYLPSLATPRRDLRRALAAARFRAPDGEGFDAFALDVEATTVRSIPRRTARAVRLVANVRSGLPHRTALGAITIDPVGARYWPRYPFGQLAPFVDVFLPMEYFTYRTRGAAGVTRYSDANVAAVRSLAGRPSFPVHPIGGAAGDATLRELHAFLRASASAGVVGTSLWEYGQTSPPQWAALATNP
jgi:hypothetical protein